MYLKELSQVIAGAQEVVIEYLGIDGKGKVCIMTSALDELVNEDAFPLLDGEVTSVWSDIKSRLRINLCTDFPEEYIDSDLFFLGEDDE